MELPLSIRPSATAAHVQGSTHIPLLNLTVPDLLKRTVARHGGGTAMIFGEQGICWTWAEFDRKVDALAIGLLGLGLMRGDRIGIWSPNRAEWVVTQFASARIGLILVTLNPAYRVDELDYALNTAGCVALVIASGFRSADYVAMVQSLAPDLRRAGPGASSAGRVPDLRIVIQMGGVAAPGFVAFDALSAPPTREAIDRLDAITAALDTHDPINIQFTSGTTGAPKGATLSHHNIVNNARFIVAGQALTDRDRLCVPVPLYHTFGMVGASLGCVASATTLVFPGEAFDADSVVRALAAERCTAVYGVPTMFVAMLSAQRALALDLTSLRTGIMGGAPCPPEIMRRCATELNLRDLTIVYGMTETSPASFQTAPDDSIEHRVESVGRALPHVECSIVDRQGRMAAPGEQGELCVRGYSVMQGYWQDAARTAEAIDADGWMHTGDLAVIDADGYCRITGRLKDMIIRGGENIYPREIEEFLLVHPLIDDVQIFGVPDPVYGEEVCAWVVAVPGAMLDADLVRAHCRGRIAHYKIPRHVRIVDRFPMTVTGKPQKFVMREEMVAALTIQSQDKGADAAS